MNDHSRVPVKGPRRIPKEIGIEKVEMPAISLEPEGGGLGKS
jgi:hypothetical protein